MIIRRHGAFELFITQTDHAELAASIMRAWRADAFDTHPRRGVILRAVREHDNGWIEEDEATLIGASGHALDFVSVPDAVKHRIWPRAVARVARRDAYEAALIAQHALTVHAQHRGNAEWQPFFDGLERTRAALLGGPAHADFERDYRFVRLGDLFSLVFCNGWTELHDLPGGGRVVLEGATLRVSVEAFGGTRLPLRILARRLPARAYASAAELRAVLSRAPVEPIEGIVQSDTL